MMQYLRSDGSVGVTLKSSLTDHQLSSFKLLDSWLLFETLYPQSQSVSVSLPLPLLDGGSLHLLQVFILFSSCSESCWLK